MKVFAKYDPLSPKINIRLCVKAGFKNQNPYTSGFFKLASELFLKGGSENEKSLLDVIDVETECNALSTSFSADATSLSAG